MGAAPAPAGSLSILARRLAECRACPRLVEWRERMGRERRAAYADQDYWARPVPGFGDSGAWLLIVGLAPGAHGSNRTGRMFTGDRSGEWLYRTLHRAGLASQPDAIARDDGLELAGTYVTAAVRCAPPGNKPAPDEWARCRTYLASEVDLLHGARVVVCLGAYAWAKTLEILGPRTSGAPRPRPPFAHGAEIVLGRWTVLGSYHPSQQNTFTGKLTESMLDAVWARALALREPGPDVPPPGPLSEGREARP